MRESDVSEAKVRACSTAALRFTHDFTMNNDHDFCSCRLITDSRNFIWQLLPYKIIGDHAPLGSYRKKCHRRENPIEMSLILLPLAR